MEEWDFASSNDNIVPRNSDGYNCFTITDLNQTGQTYVKTFYENSDETGSYIQLNITMVSTMDPSGGGGGGGDTLNPN